MSVYNGEKLNIIGVGSEPHMCTVKLKNSAIILSFVYKITKLSCQCLLFLGSDNIGLVEACACTIELLRYEGDKRLLDTTGPVISDCQNEIAKNSPYIQAAKNF